MRPEGINCFIIFNTQLLFLIDFSVKAIFNSIGSKTTKQNTPEPLRHNARFSRQNMLSRKKIVMYLFMYILIPLITFINSSESNNDAKIVTQRIYVITQISMKLNQIIIINNLVETENIYF
jgi:hypothetical protein